MYFKIVQYEGDERTSNTIRVVFDADVVVGLLPALPTEDGRTWVLMGKMADRSKDFLAVEHYGTLEKRLLRAKGYREGGAFEMMSCCHSGSIPEPVDSEGGVE